ncbi:hypothetical protein CC86DRAFT_397449 [Ophiobolus disseminans]|uniref:Zn(2)-C6 fungal-type domain-containing protein n=1 Tax=Ophiobolus disseminans TaxID=1469910 RepID=A0A6A6ZK94_9PLEO|nr:hypothetical protein CC86DRAFT_397449 [Ophiobolus disseminans]
MLRRSHKKSRGGCVECKRRHVKCDENRPICRLCVLSDRDCSFASQDQQQQHDPSSRERSIESDRRHGETVLDLRNITPLTPVSIVDSPGNLPAQHPHDASLDDAINFDHMELLIHAIQDREMFEIGTGVGEYHASGIALGLKEALAAPYLMHELLAFSAQHMAFLHPERSAHYLHQAVSLQTRAISLFNTTWTEVNKSNCVAILLFSSILGHHLLADTLRKRDPGGLDAFIAHYVQCVEMHRGIYTIAKSAWPLLMQSELEPILTQSTAFTSRQPKGNDCEPIKKLINNSTALSQVEKDACHHTIQYLQVGIDAVAAKQEIFVNRHQMIYSLTMLVPPEMAALLAKKQPEALVLLAYYAILLHHGRELWQSGDAGLYVFGLINGYLGEEWDEWMQYPREKIVGDMAME